MDPQGLPLRRLTDGTGQPALVELALPDSARLRARIWVAQVGRVPLLLLDSDIPENEHELRGVTDRLYGGDQEHRMQQEILAGIGGIRAIRAFTAIEGLPAPEVFHMNEGHAGFLGAQRIRELVDAGLDFDTALTVVRSSTVFTTHTPVPAGIDRFPMEMVQRYFADASADPDGHLSSPLLPGVPLARIKALGAEDDPEKFNMAHMGLRLAQRANGVSLLHSVVKVAERCSTSCGPDSTSTRCRSARSPTVRTRAPGRRRNGWSSVANWRDRTRSANPASGCDSKRSTRVICGGSGHSCGRCWLKTSAPGCDARGSNAVHLTPN